jgi:spore germination protein GerM
MDHVAGVDMPIRGNKIDQIKDDAYNLTSALNKTAEDFWLRHPQGDGMRKDFPQSKLQRIEQQVADIEMVNDQHLTQKIGSDGAQDSLAEIIITLAEHPGIKDVYFTCTAVNQAIPGLNTRKSVTAFKIVLADGRER